MIFEVRETGELIEITDVDFVPEKDAVYIFISTYHKLCYLWFGKESGVRKQFIAAKEGRKIKMDTAYSTSNVKHEGEEDAFEEALEKWREDLKEDRKPAAVALEQRARIQKMNIDTETPFDGPQKHKSSRRTSKPTTIMRSVSSDVTIQKKEVPEDDHLDMIISKLTELDPVEDHIRDYIVTSGYVYSTTKNEDVIEVELLDKVKNGVFEVDNYKPRFFIEDSNLIAIEMWRIPK